MSQQWSCADPRNQPAASISSHFITETDDAMMRCSRARLKCDRCLDLKKNTTYPKWWSYSLWTYLRKGSSVSRCLREDLPSTVLKVKTTTKEMLIDSMRKQPTRAPTTINGAQSLRWKSPWLMTSPGPYALPLLRHHVWKHRLWPLFSLSRRRFVECRPGGRGIIKCCSPLLVL